MRLHVVAAARKRVIYAEGARDLYTELEGCVQKWISDLSVTVHLLQLLLSTAGSMFFSRILETIEVQAGSCQLLLYTLQNGTGVSRFFFFVQGRGDQRAMLIPSQTIPSQHRLAFLATSKYTWIYIDFVYNIP